MDGPRGFGLISARVRRACSRPLRRSGKGPDDLLLMLNDTAARALNESA